MRKVVITGIGMVTPIGASLEEAATVFLQGRPVVRPMPRPSAGRDRVGATVDEDLSSGWSAPALRLLERFSLMALRASDRAMAAAELRSSDFDSDRAGVFLGNGSGPSQSMYDLHATLLQRDTLPGTTVLKMMPNAAASQVAIRHAFRGECLNISTACSSSSHAIGQAMRAVRSGYLDVALAGGTEAPMGESHLRSWEAMRVLATVDPEHPETASRPFSKTRSGIVMGEGAVIYVLEEEAHARSRGAHALAAVAGYGSTNDSTHIAIPDARGQAQAMRACLLDGGCAPGDIGYINAHGTATQLGDVVETQSIRNVFGAGADAIPISSTKSIHGHLLGASGAIEMLAAIVALREGIVAPTANLDVPDPECDLDYVPNESRRGVTVDAVMSNSFAFGGGNVSLLLTR